MRLAIIGQSVFGAEVYKLLKERGHEIVGVFTIPDKNNRPDPLAAEAQKDGVPLFKVARWRANKQIIPQLLENYKSVNPELNVLAFCSQFIPMDVINYPVHHSIVYHPSLLPKHRGASAINWTLINGDDKAGLTVFWADDGLDTGPMLLQKECPVLPNDSVDSLYSRFLLPEGVKAMAEAVDLIANNRAPHIIQTDEGASYDPHISAKPELAEINWDQPAHVIHNFIRGCDKVPGAWSSFGEKKVAFYGSELWNNDVPENLNVIDDAPVFAGTHASGMLLKGNDNKYVNVHFVSSEDTGMIPASRYGQMGDANDVVLDFNENELVLKTAITNSWKNILNTENFTPDTDFFKSGAGSLDVTRLLEELHHMCGVELEPEIVYLNPKFGQFVNAVILKMRDQSSDQKMAAIDLVKLTANGMEVSFPHQLFIDGQFVDSVSGETYETINPANESVICSVSKAGIADVNAAVEAAKKAFEAGSWSNMSASDRGRILYRLADVLEEHKEELATIESIDSGAVYTLALKTHIGMSINTWRYFAGWCDKIQGSTIPISSARPNKNLTFTKKEPIG
ncbi:unnamed protein product [Soboliphyme baturini]|uniref:formyltetrahydrofolate dehydrogenase n=1 Tax=Soboliphyme baturini TaxID=241478 RepID=A0A183ILN2_9BILA|nr:unnamed protein product [Soboliphyme baturini]